MAKFVENTDLLSYLNQMIRQTAGEIRYVTNVSDHFFVENVDRDVTMREVNKMNLEIIHDLLLSSYVRLYQDVNSKIYKSDNSEMIIDTIKTIHKICRDKGAGVGTPENHQRLRAKTRNLLQLYKHHYQKG